MSTAPKPASKGRALDRSAAKTSAPHNAAAQPPIDRRTPASRETKEKPSQQERLAYGRHTVMEAMNSGEVERLFLQEGLQGERGLQPFVKTAQDRGISVQWVSESYFSSRVGVNPHQGVLALVKEYRYAHLDVILKRAEERRAAGDLAGATILLLDGMEDPGNFGGILRTAAGLGIAGVIVPNRRMVGVTAAVRKASAGTIGRVPIAQVANLRYALDPLKEAGWWSVGATMEGTLTPAGLPNDVPLALVMGSEHDGLSPLLGKSCDFTVRIPLASGVESLNVGAAAAILMAAIVLRA